METNQQSSPSNHHDIILTSSSSLDDTPIGFRGDPSRLYPPSKRFQCRERIVWDQNHDANSNNDDDDDDDDDSYENEYYGNVVAFECNILPQQQQQQQQQQREPLSLLFYCREPSCGVLLQEEPAVQKTDDEYAVDPSFFDPGYTMAGKTGFQVWPGSRLLVQALLLLDEGNNTTTETITTTSNGRLQYWQTAIQQGIPVHEQDGNFSSNDTTTTSRRRPLRILELGAGVGVVGTLVAAAGGPRATEVLVTDLPTLVTQSLRPNLVRNAKLLQAQQQQQSTTTTTTDSTVQPTSATPTTTTTVVEDPPKWLASSSSSSSSSSTTTTTTTIPIHMPGGGWIAATALDWTKPVVPQQLTVEQCQAVDLILASDCVWLVSMLQGLLSTVAEICRHDCHVNNDNNNNHPPKSFLMSFQRRDPDPSSNGNKDATTEMFTTVDRVLAEFQARNWNVECLAWNPVVYKNPEQQEGTTNSKVNDTTTKEVFLFEITLPPSHSSSTAS